MLNREEGLKFVRELIKNENLVRHHLAAEVCMKAIWRHLSGKGVDLQGKSEDDWGLVGLLHDADYELTKDPLKHTLVLEEELKKRNPEIDPEVLNAIKFHNKDNVACHESLMGWAIYICDELTGLIVACALILPDKKLANIDVAFVQKRFKQPAFARGADRNRIMPCEEKLGIPLPEFISICLSAMQEAHVDLGL